MRELPIYRGAVKVIENGGGHADMHVVPFFSELTGRVIIQGTTQEIDVNKPWSGSTESEISKVDVVRHGGGAARIKATFTDGSSGTVTMPQNSKCRLNDHALAVHEAGAEDRMRKKAKSRAPLIISLDPLKV